MEEWKEYKLGDLVSLVIDYRGKTPLKLGSNWAKSGYRALSAKNIKTGRIVNEDSIRYVDEELYKLWMKEEIQRGDILITSEAPFGQIFYWDSEEKIVLSQRLFCLRFDKKNCSRFIYYYMTTDNFQKELDGRATGTTVVGLRQPELLKCRVLLPSFEHQHSIASILKSLDDKIENNRRINENLEQQAQALFKSWFVDFEPFKDGKFVESELGLIPEGWRVASLGEIAVLKKISMKPFEGTIYKHYSIPAFDKGKIPTLENGSNIKSNKFRIYNGAVLLSKLNPTSKRIWYVGDIPENSITSTEFMPFYSKNPNYTPFVYCYLNCENIYRELANSAKGTTNSHQRIDANTIIRRPLVYSEDIINEFCKYVQPMLQKILLKERESLRLAALRDTLLPRLMSGELKVNDL